MTTSPRRVLVLGASGFLGANVVHSARAEGREIICHTSASRVMRTPDAVISDLMIRGNIAALVESARPDVVVNCAALADVDRCEFEPRRSHRLNAELPGELAEACASQGIRLIHVSTDAVFDGVSGPFERDSPTSPINTYGRHKAMGEERVLTADPNAIVARTNIIGWSPSGRRSLLEYFHDHLIAGNPAPGFTDIYFRPVPVHRFWSACERLLKADCRGAQHVTGDELLSKYEFGKRVATVFGLDGSLVVERSGRSIDRAAVRAPNLDVRPTILPSGESVITASLDSGLEELRLAALRGLRSELAAGEMNP